MHIQYTRSFAERSPEIRSNTPLSDEQIQRVAPSIFSASKHDSRSERYAYIATIELLNALRKEGFQPFYASQNRVRKEHKRDFTKHMLRLRHAGDIQSTEANEIVLLNSHDGSSSFQLMGGLLRFVCNNGLVAGKEIQDIRIRHSGDVVDSVVQGAHTILDGFDLVREKKETFKSIALQPEEASAFSRAALNLRYGDGEKRAAPITEDQLLQTRRAEDTKSDLWTVLNVVQENTIKGGLKGRSASGRRQRTRAVNGITQNVQLNKALWVLADAMAKIKS